VSLFLLTMSGCGAPSIPADTVSLSPSAVAVATGQTVQFRANSSNMNPIQWFVNGILNGSPTDGTIDSSGNYIAPAQATAITVFVTARSQTRHPGAAFATVHVIPSGQVSATQHPQVARYNVTTPPRAQAFIEFGTDTNYGLRTSTLSPPPGGGAMEFLVAGMRAFTLYHMRAIVKFPEGTVFFDKDQVFTTGGPQPGELPTITTQTAPGQNPQPGIELVTQGGRPSTAAYAADLAGNAIWWYKAPDGSNAVVPQPVQPLANGHFLVSIGPPSTDVFTGVVEPPGTIEVLREIDLAGNTVREISVPELNKRLAAAGLKLQVDLMHHDAIPLPNGHWIVITNEVREISNLPGTTGPVGVLGDGLVDLDESLQPVWVWSTFDHLDINRHPFLFPDWTHANAVVYLPQDGNLLLSMRHQNWIIKIDYHDGKGAGDVLWRLGEGGDFTLSGGIDPTDWFYAQHGPSIFSTESSSVFSLSVMDNGNDRQLPAGQSCATLGTTPCPYSTVGIYRLDETAMTAALTFHDVPDQFSFFGGNTRLLANGNLEFDLCATATVPPHAIIEEIDPRIGPQPIWQMDISQFAYRAFRIPSLYPGVQW
jgi:arylsulfate sulfotransferase